MQTNQSQIWSSFGIPPSKANLRIVGPLQNPETVNRGLFEMGLTAEDLQPVDWRKATISHTRNQQQCGDCWAMSSTSALQDRFMIQKGLKSLNLQPGIVAQCCANSNGIINQGCGGGLPFLAGQYFETNGLPEIKNDCPSWFNICPSQTDCTLPSCSAMEQLCKQDQIYKAVQGSTKSLPVINGANVDKASTIINMKRELIKGPMVLTFFVPKDFMASAMGYNWDSTNGIFINGAYNDYLDKNASSALRNVLGNPNGTQWQDIMMEGGGPAGHAVELVGWDTGNAGKYGSVDYWIIRNSWGTGWGDNGYFKFAMNNNDAGLNQYLGMDIPVSSLHIVSSNTSSSLGGLFGGATSFDPDINSGRSGSGPQTVPTKTEQRKIQILPQYKIKMVS